MFPDLTTATLVTVGALLLLFALLLLAWSARLRARTGLPAERVVYSDTQAGGVPGRALYSPRYNLTGKPDYLLATHKGTVPVEVKPERDDDEPRESHLLQVLAYCLLVEEDEGRAPPHGLLRYRNATFVVDYNLDTRAYLLGVIADIEAARKAGEAHRSHDQPGRCRGCLYRPICNEALE